MTNDDLQFRTAVSNELTGASLLRLLSGDEYDVGDLFVDVANGNTKRVVLVNNTVDKIFLILQPSVHSSGQVHLWRTQNVTVDTEGTQITIVNSKTDVDNGLQASAFTAGDGEAGVVSGGQDHPRLTAGSGTNSSNAGAGASEGASVTNVVMPGDSLAVNAQNQSGSTRDISLSWVFFVLPESTLSRLPFEE